LTPLLRDEFLSGIVGRPSFRVGLPAQGRDDATIDAIRAAQQHPVFLYAKLPTESLAAVAQLEELGFHLIDTNVTLERKAAGQRIAPATIRPARPGDRDAVMAIAATSFTYSRLHLDPAIPRAVADRSRAQWAGNFFAGSRGDRMIVGESDGALAGFAQLLGPSDGVVTIDLIGVAEPYRRRGIAGTLIAASAEIAGAQILRVGTQIANAPSLRLYQALGFRIVASQSVLHYHRV
jgi:ribosomal protein S18 acetylase RimI-like enzyme